MPTQLQLRRGTTNQHNTFTGVVGEVTINTTKKTAVVHDGSTAGGLELLRADMSNVFASATPTITSLNTSGDVSVGGNLTVTGTTTFNGGTITMGDADTDNVVFGADVNSNILPNTDNTYALGSSSKKWSDVRSVLLTTTGDATIGGDVAVNGGDLTTSQTTFNLLNTTATTLNVGGASTATAIGAATGTTTVKADLTVDGDVQVKGGDLTTNQTTFNLLNTTATTLNIGGASTTLEIGAATGTTNINNNLDVDGDVNIDGGDLTVSTTTFNLANTTATTLNIGGAATSLNLGAATGTTTVGNNLTVTGDLTVSGNTTTLNTSTLEVEDKNITLGNTQFPTNLTAAGGGITLKGTTDKTIVYNNVSNSWDLSENLKLASGKTFSINNDQIVAPNGLGQYTLGTTVVTSSLVSVGNLISLQMAGTGTSGLNLQDGTISVATGNIGLNPVAGAITVNGKKIIDLPLPTNPQDATNKEYVDDAIFARGITLSMDITGLNNTEIAAILDNIAPFYNPTGTPEEQEGVAINGTILRLHGTITTATSADLDYSPNVGDEFSTIEVSTPTGVAQVVSDIVTGQTILAPALTVSIARQNKKFTMTSGNWAFTEDIA